ncbi:T9SS type A sorting domain-containing protein [Cesiribacter sp. SM1]|uniref:T9SS type A sorting domain-containing protein n=1 Tax=Cesiribacter sp. SM1 TaxID=2861196 RepID=UPI001CD464FD|nr:T9SS type A sorting domain-containing protein [Cesiribacter sp. SM1]
MKQLYILLLFAIYMIAGSGVQAQVRSGSGTPAYNTPKEFAFSGDRVIDPRSDVKLFPNPAVEYLVVEINSQDLINVSFELNNIIGNTFEIRSEPIGNNRYKIYVKDLRPGYYFLTLKDENSSYKRAYRFLKK